jgi:hypothetical protein
MAAKPTELVAVKVRLREKTRRLLEAAAKREGHGSVNREIERRLERSFLDEGNEALIQSAAATAVGEFAKVIAREFGRIGQMLDRIDRTLKLHEVILMQGKAKKD